MLRGFGVVWMLGHHAYLLEFSLGTQGEKRIMYQVNRRERLAWRSSG